MVSLRAARKTKGCTLRSVANYAGISEAYYSMIERGLRRPSPQKAKRIAEFLGFDWTQFFEEDAQGQPAGEDA